MMSYLEDLVRDNTITLVIVEHVFNIPTILKFADNVWNLSNGKLTINKNDEQTNKSEETNMQDLLKTMGGENGRTNTKELPGGASLTTIATADSQESPVALEVQDLIVKRGLRTVINGLSFSLKKGQLSILHAPNGWGKSTLLDTIVGINPVESGSIILKGKELNSMPIHERVKYGLAYLRSNQQAFASLTVGEHKRLTNTVHHMFNGHINKDSKGSFLSGGEKQKLLIDMLPDAEVYLLDDLFPSL